MFISIGKYALACKAISSIYEKYMSMYVSDVVLALVIFPYTTSTFDLLPCCSLKKLAA